MILENHVSTSAEQSRSDRSSTSAHTPGPWMREPQGGRGSWIRGENGEWAALACGDTDESANANACLIAGAPEMLAALKRLEAFGSQELQTRNVKFTIAQKIAALNAARAAIAKATGA
jgi:hypothetical protein